MSPSVHLQRHLPPVKKDFTQSLPSPDMFHHNLAALVGQVNPKSSKWNIIPDCMAWSPNLAHCGGLDLHLHIHFEPTTFLSTSSVFANSKTDRYQIRLLDQQERNI